MALPRRYWTLALLAMSSFVISLDNTILNVALPTLSRSLHASNAELQWIVDSFLLVFAGLLLTGGSLGDRFGRATVLRWGLALFGAASAVGAFSSSAPALVVGRAVMGAGGALIQPTTLSTVSNVFHDPRERARAIGLYAGV